MDERSRKKKYETRKSVNIIVHICKSLDMIDEGLEYNLTVESLELKTFINTSYTTTVVGSVEDFKEVIKTIGVRSGGKTSVMEGPYSSLITLRVTQHDGPFRYGPWYICIIAKRERYTYVPEAVELIGVKKDKTFESILRCYYTADTDVIVKKFVEALSKLLKELK